MNKAVTYILFVALLFAAFAVVCQACGGHDAECFGDNGAQATCCDGMHCQKNDPSWRNGRCYYNPGK
ncbi:hypothetical protein I4U23_011791 [Adineta vaga]|nr:hypothetical protein I4U23_011791 [Adineta vaga]